MAELLVTRTSLPLQRSLTRRERLDLPRRITMLSAGLVVFIVGMLLVFIGVRGLTLFVASGVPITDILSATWAPNPDNPPNTFGLLPFILGTVGITVLAALIAAPLSIGLAVFMSEVAPAWARNIIRPAMEVFVGIPSVVYGFLGASVLVPFLQHDLRGLGFTFGKSWFAGSLVLSLMILPTITSIAYDALITVPGDLRMGSLALGTTRWQTIRHILLPAARAGILTAIILGMMRAAGEALAVQMVIGNRVGIPFDPTKPIAAMTAQITIDMGNTTFNQPWNQALWTMGLILLLMSFGFVTIARRIGRRATRS
ncbi:MAG TPA: phosphate ABC transporter permease subunit PstC [Candidatus Limnocylindrales bacterium]|nr:phosphate ABC transporter permease subunit PstC [Candidatus Limnocylindrales bacterium]